MDLFVVLLLDNEDENGNIGPCHGDTHLNPVKALESKKIRGAALDVMEYEKSSFETIFSSKIPKAFSSLLKADNVIFSPHVAGWTIESHRKLAQTIVDKIKFQFH